jgi:steroid delta-isomerase-like uncharacterized protein
MSDKNRAMVRQFFDEVCNGRKLSIADHLFGSDHVYHDPSNPSIGRGPRGMQELVSTYQTAFPDARWKIEAMLGEGDSVVTRWTGTGTHHGVLAGMAPTGKSVVVSGIWIHKFSGGKIVESWNVWDTLGMMQQLGKAE